MSIARILDTTDAIALVCRAFEHTLNITRDEIDFQIDVRTGVQVL
jgi:hypothetical protein